MAARKSAPPVSVATAAASGDLRATLEAMRDDLARSMDAASPAVKAQLSGQMLKTLAALAALSPTREGSKLDEVKQRREARRAAAKAAPAAGRGGR